MSGIAYAIGARRIAPDQAPYVIAEAGVNHNGSAELAHRLVDAASEAGADAVKFQTFSADALVTSTAPQAAYQARSAPASDQRAMLAALELPLTVLTSLRDHAMNVGVAFLSTPFDEDSLQVLVELGVPALKIGSGDLTNGPLLRAAAASGRPLVISTGMATLEEIDAAIALIGDTSLALMQCTSAYPTPPEDANVRAIPALRGRYGVEVGFSDHTVGLASATAAVALGATLVEKHLTLDRAMDGPDHAASAEPHQLAELVRSVREAHVSLGDGVKAPRPIEEEMRRVARRSLVAARPLPAGHRLTARDLAVKRPADGLSPMELDAVVGRRLRRALDADAFVRYEDVDPAPF